MKQPQRAHLFLFVFCLSFVLIYWVTTSLALSERHAVDIYGRLLPPFSEPGLSAPEGSEAPVPHIVNDHIFASYTTYPAGAPDAVGIGDFNHDGLNDVATSNGATLRVFIQQPNGTLTNSVNYVSGNRSESLSVGDFNHDGLDDIVTLNFNDDDISVFLQEADGTMAPRITYNTSASPDASAVGGINHDGLDDIAVSHWNAGNIRIYYQQPDGSLLNTSYSSPNAGYDDIDVGDLNDDSLIDVVKLNGQTYANPDLSVFIQNGGGSLNSATSYDLPGGNILGNGVAAGDITGDGLTDLAVTRGGNRPSSKLVVYTQTVTGSLAVAATYDAYDIPEPIEIADVDMDGRQDVVMAHGGWNRIGVFLQNQDGTLAPYELYPIPFASHYDPQGLDVGDINNDCAPDVVLADYNNGLVVLYNELPSFLVTAVPDQITAAPGTTMTTTVYITSANGFTGNVTPTLSGWPSGSYTFAENSISASGSTELSLTVPPTMPHGTYPLIIQSEGSGVFCQENMTVEVDDIPIFGLIAMNNSPTLIGNTTTLSAPVSSGNGVTYYWDLGDGTFINGSEVSHTYSLTGTYTAVVTASNALNFMTATTDVMITSPIIPPNPDSRTFLAIVIGQPILVEFDPILIGQLIPIGPVTTPGETYYLTSISIPAQIPTNGRYYLSASPSQVEPIVVDDELVMHINTTVHFSYQFSNPGDSVPTPAIVEVPLHIMQTFNGQTVFVSYRDIFGNSVGATEIWLMWVP